MEKTWKIMREIIGKSTKYQAQLSLKIITNKEEITDQKEIAVEFI